MHEDVSYPQARNLNLHFYTPSPTLRRRQPYAVTNEGVRIKTSTGSTSALPYK